MRIIFYLVYGCWWASEMIINSMLRSSPSDKQNEDKQTLWLLWTVIFLADMAAITASFYHTTAISANPSVSYIGLALMIAGMIFRIYAIRSLGRMFTVDVTIREGHKLNQQGIYKYLRHPSYTGALLTFFGFGLSLNNWLSLVLVIVPVGIAFARRIYIEEKALLSAFPDEYLMYKKKTFALIPFVY